MQDDLYQEDEPGADERLAAARELLVRRRYRDALDLVNSVVLALPSDPRAFVIRAAAFEGMDLIPQADADLAHARRLCEQQGFDFAALVDEINQPPQRPERKRRPSPPPRARGSGAGAGELAIIIGFIVFLAAAVGVGTYIVIGSLDLRSGGDSGAAPASGPARTRDAASGSVTPGAQTAAATPTPRASLPPGVDGNPYSLSSVESAWEAQGLAVGLGSAATGFSGFTIAPTAVNVSGSGASARTAVFVYKDSAAPAGDWTLVIGERPAARPGRTVPAHFTIYWNTNVVVVVLDDPGAIGEDLLNGVLNMTP